MSDRDQELERVAFQSKTGEANEQGCLLWNGSKDARWGYGLFHFRGKNKRAHRFAWEMKYGPIPAGMMVCHHCDNPTCVNVDHLFLGTNQDNVNDRNAKGRQSRGITRPGAKLTDEAVRDIRTSKLQRKYLVEKYGVHPTNINRVKRGVAWMHVT